MLADDLLLFHPFSCRVWTTGARASGGGETQGGGAEDEVWGEGETDPRSAREPERTAKTAAAAGERPRIDSTFNTGHFNLNSQRQSH